MGRWRMATECFLEYSLNHSVSWFCMWNVYLLRITLFHPNHMLPGFYFLECRRENWIKYHCVSHFHFSAWGWPWLQNLLFKAIASAATGRESEPAGPQLASSWSLKQWAVVKTFPWFHRDSREKTHTRKDPTAVFFVFFFFWGKKPDSGCGNRDVEIENFHHRFSFFSSRILQR